jgi:hypothetical protein
VFEAVHPTESHRLAVRKAVIFRAMKFWTRTIRVVAAIALFFCAWQVNGQAGSNTDQSSGAYRLQLSVDEVILTFHATDVHGLPINDLTLGEIKLFDKGIAPRRIVAFDSLIDRPVRAGRPSLSGMPRGSSGRGPIRHSLWILDTLRKSRNRLRVTRRCWSKVFETSSRVG